MRGWSGDQRVVVNVVIPRKLNDEQRRLLGELNATLTEDNLRDPAEDGSIFARVKRAFS